MPKKIKASCSKKSTYDLIKSLVSVEVKCSDDGDHTYRVTEPILTKQEKETKEKIVNGLLEMLDIELSSIKKRGEALRYLEEQVNKILDEYEIKLTDKGLARILYYVQRDFIGLNEIEPLMQDPNIEDISCDGIGIPIYIVHRQYGSIRSNIIYKDEKTLKDFVVKLAERCGRFVSYAEPLLDGTLPDGSRVQATFATDVTTKGPSFTIRKFVPEPYSPVDLIDMKTVNPEMLAYLWLAVENGSSILISGGAGTGKTTLLNVLLMFIPTQSKIITIEDTRELNIPHENWVPSVTRVGFAKGYGEVTMFDLLKESFRQTPDYVVVGEVRGKEAYVMFQGMASGIPAMGTMHAGRVEDVIYRLETPPINLSPSLIDTLDLVIVMIHARDKDESARRVKEVVEIESIAAETGKARTNSVYRWQPKEDIFSFKGVSWLLQQIAVQRGVETSDLLKEIKRRTELLELVYKKKIKNFRDVVEIISDYKKNPEKTLEKLRS